MIRTILLFLLAASSVRAQGVQQQLLLVGSSAPVSDTFNLAVGQVHDNGIAKAQSYIYYATNVAGGKTAVTVNVAGGSSLVTVSVWEFSGVDPSPIDATASNTTVTTTVMSCGTITTTNANDAIIASIADAVSASHAAESGYTIPANSDSAGGTSSGTTGTASGAGEYKIVSSTGSFTPHITMSANSLPAVCVTAAVKQAGGGSLALVNTALSTAGTGFQTSRTVTISPTTAGNALFVHVWLHTQSPSTNTVTSVTD